MELAHDASLIRAARYSCVPGAGLNLVMCSAMPIGVKLAASTCMAVQVTLTEVAAMAAVPMPPMPPVFKGEGDVGQNNGTGTPDDDPDEFSRAAEIGAENCCRESGWAGAAAIEHARDSIDDDFGIGSCRLCRQVRCKRRNGGHPTKAFHRYLP